MNRICIIIPYFGKLPSNMYTFLFSCKMNSNVKWLIFTDQNVDEYENICKNVQFIKSNLHRIKNRILEVTGFNDVVLSKPYKLCDYRPLYGLIFSKYLKNYKYWGYSDLDIVYGNLGKYICNGILNNYMKIGNCGHFTLFRNIKRINNLYKLPIYVNHKKSYLFKDIVIHSTKPCHFDEYAGINVICKQYDISTYVNSNLVNEVSFQNMDLQTRDKRFSSYPSCYVWHNGHAYYFYIRDHELYRHEYGYFHFQKRYLFKNFVYEPVPTFAVTTYGYNIIKFKRQSIMKSINMNKSSFIKRFIYILKYYIFNGAILHSNFKRIFKRIFIYHNFSV